jgi:ABC-type transporter Mla subunit MlaD
MKCLSVLLIGALVPLAMAVSAQTADVRRVVSNGRAITEQLRPGDRQVVLEINAYPPLLAKADAGQSQLDVLTQPSETVLVAVVEVKRPQLTERQNWIKSLVEARVAGLEAKPEPSCCNAGPGQV